jgi:hypothetical protein
MEEKGDRGGAEGRPTIVCVRVSIAAESLALGCELQGLRTRRVDLGFIILGLVVAVATGGFVVWGAEVGSAGVLQGHGRGGRELTDGGHCESSKVRDRTTGAN